MGLIWLQQSNGRKIHLPVNGNDVNTPDTAINVGMVQAVAIDRCYSQAIAVNHPIFGQFTIDMMPEGITGSCNQCGHCCTHLVENCADPNRCIFPYRADIDCHACQYLVVKRTNKWAQANNTSCNIYSDILNIYKGCAYPPDVIDPLWINCGYSVI